MGNSVVYRPAYDAEVEYLESDGNSFIDTGLKASSELGILAHIYVTGIFPFGGRNGLNNKEFSFCALQNGNSGFRFGSSIAIAQGGRLNGLYEFDNTQNHNILKVGNTSYVATYNSFISDYNVFLFGLNNAGVAENISSRIYDFKIYQNSTLVRDFIPVRIGSVGYMYDKVSKQLFANKGTGQFILGNDVSNAVIPQQRCVLYFGNQRSVGFERIYEEYEWLKGDGSAYLYLGEVQNYIEFDVDLQQEVKADVFIYGLNGQVRYGYNGQTLKVLVPENRIKSYNVPLQGTIRIDFSTHYAYFNGEQFGHTDLGTGYGDENCFKKAYFFGYEQLSSFRSRYVSLGEVNMDGSNLTPVRLLRPIPAILDGNGIARQAGECGMWDKVSNKFYGNVASSGTFTVKGPKCYEEYDTLLMDNGGATIPSTGSYFRLSNDISLTNKVLTINLGDTYRDLVISGDTVDGSTYMILIYTYSSGSTTIQERHGNNNTISTKTYSSKIVILDFQNNVATVGTQQFNIQGTGYKFSDSTAAYWSRIKYLKNITVDNELNLTPCKLTHGIPASMDAYGIARPAGTCGMWDKVNDVFYGNVASSGSFTVSND